MKLGNYEATEVKPGLWVIDDRSGDSLYLVIGNKKALLIDTGLEDVSLLLELRKLTDKPIELALTHAHMDHMFNADEFDKVYMHQNDIDAWYRIIMETMKLLSLGKSETVKRVYDVKNYIPIDKNTVFDLGGIKIRVIEAFGHTPGSVLFVDEVHQAVFTGDAFGSGCGAWMWLPESSTITQYKQSLEKVILDLEKYSTYTYFGGHRKQSIPTKEIPYACDLTYQTIKDMKILCDKILAKELEPTEMTEIGPFKLPFYIYGTAAALEKEDKLI